MPCHGSCPFCAAGATPPAPSGTFCTPMPSASAAAAVRPSDPPESAKASPTAIPSGILCRVMAVMSMELFSAEPPRRSRSISASSAQRKAAPAAVPAAAGSQHGRTPAARVCSIAGRSMLHTEAAVITPPAKPIIPVCDFGSVSSRQKSTEAAPKEVIRNIKPTPSAAQPTEESIADQRLIR